MHKVSAAYITPDEIEERIKEREAQVSTIPEGPARQSVLVEIAKLRAYADIKRWLDSRAPRAWMSYPAGRPKQLQRELVTLDLANDEQALMLAEKLASKLGRTVIVHDASGKEVCVAPARRKLDS